MSHYHNDRRFRGRSGVVQIPLQEDKELNVDYQRSISDTAGINLLEQQDDQRPSRVTLPQGKRRGGGRGRGRYRGN